MRIIVPLIATCLLMACGHPAPPVADQPTAPPVVFQEKGTIEKIARYEESIRSYDADVVSSMFEEELTRDTALSNLLASVGMIGTRIQDSAVAYLRFAQNNATYYTAADVHIASLADSTERANTHQRFEQSEQRLNDRLASTAALLTTSNKLTNEVGQLRIAIMLDRTLDRMEAYQTQQPSSTGMASGVDALRAVRDQLKKELF
jgi:hypothetical protein